MLPCMSSGMCAHLYPCCIETLTHDNYYTMHTCTERCGREWGGGEGEREETLSEGERFIVLFHTVSPPFRTVSDTR